MNSTRKMILNKAFELIYKNGYKATSVDTIIDTTDVTKGAFYYHFKNKREMGLAMIEEVIVPRLHSLLIAPLKPSEDVLGTIYATIYNDLLKNHGFDVRYGCPINNLIQELGPADEHFKRSLRAVLNSWKRELCKLLEYGKIQGQIDENVRTSQVAEFVIVGYEGLRGTGKVYENFELYRSYMDQLDIYFRGVRATMKMSAN